MDIDGAGVKFACVGVKIPVAGVKLSAIDCQRLGAFAKTTAVVFKNDCGRFAKRLRSFPERMPFVF